MGNKFSNVFHGCFWRSSKWTLGRQRAAMPIAGGFFDKLPTTGGNDFQGQYCWNSGWVYCHLRPPVLVQWLLVQITLLPHTPIQNPGVWGTKPLQCEVVLDVKTNCRQLLPVENLPIHAWCLLLCRSSYCRYVCFVYKSHSSLCRRENFHWIFCLIELRKKQVFPPEGSWLMFGAIKSLQKLFT